MCGICGEIRLGGNGRVQREHVRAMSEALVHRGPDASGLFISPDEQVGLGFRRLSIIDISPSANQPLANEDETIHLVFNGEVYNFLELRKRLESRGHRFRSRSDAETVLHLYEDKGPDCVKEIEGMFAFGIWDQRQRHLTLARDRSGKKPLFYARREQRLVFASEIKAFFAHPEVDVQIDPSSVPSYFIHGYVPTPQTFYEGVRQLEPATVLVCDGAGRIDSRTFWDLHYPSTAEVSMSAASPRQAARGVRERLRWAVERRLASDVPLGAFLSGGIDSTIVVGLMRELTGSRVRTFSIGFEGDDAYDETAYARLAATRFGTDHTEFKVTPETIELIETLIWHHDGPFGDASAIPTFIVSRLTREHVTVVLTGDGGDEVFAGYRRFHGAVLAERIPSQLAVVLERIFSALPTPASDRHWLAFGKRFVKAARLPLYERITRWAGLFFGELEGLLNPEFRASLEPIDPIKHLRGDIELNAQTSTLSKVLHANFRSYLLDDLLVKTDRCTMANSLEARSPFLDRELVEYVATLPDDMKLHRGRTKVILRESCSDLLPPEIATRGKMGFGVPLDAWFRGSLRDRLSDVLLAPGARYSEYLSTAYVRDLVVRQGRGEINAGLRLWSILCFEEWLRLLPVWQRAAPESALRSSPSAVPT